MPDLTIPDYIHVNTTTFTWDIGGVARDSCYHCEGEEIMTTNTLDLAAVAGAIARDEAAEAAMTPGEWYRRGNAIWVKGEGMICEHFDATDADGDSIARLRNRAALYHKLARAVAAERKARADILAVARNGGGNYELHAAFDAATVSTDAALAELASEDQS